MSQLRQLSVTELQVGQYIILPPPWHKHPFLRSRFRLEDLHDVEELARAGILRVTVDEGRSRVAPVPPAAPAARRVEPPPPARWNQEELVTPALRELIHDPYLSAPAKARLLHAATADMLGRLMRQPSLERVQEFKQGLTELVDQVLSNDALASGLLRLTAHDVYTWGHSVNVGLLSLLLARNHYRHSDAHDLHELAAGFFLHDIGKVFVNPALLNKRGRFTEAERLEMRAHPALGLQLVQESGSLDPAVASIVGQHHERVGGGGYPHGLEGGEIHPYAQICALADVYDALTSVRSYKTSLGAFEALRVIRREMVTDLNFPLFEGLVRLLYE
ncbi:MAG: HD domain-containing phosphohydrolase [Candidatus Delongbacteria bacterium]